MTYKLAFVALILLGLTGFVAIRLGHFPVAMVNSHFVSEADFEEAIATIINTGNNGNILPDGQELRRQALEWAIEDALTHRSLAKHEARVIILMSNFSWDGSNVVRD